MPNVAFAARSTLAAVVTDEHGDFWLEATGATGVQKMSASIGVGACNHAACRSSESPIFLAK